MADQIVPAKSTSIASLLRNPLVIYGLVFLAGDGPLLIAYISSKTPEHATFLMYSMVAFIFAMGAVFCYLVLFRPRHLYSPEEIPEWSIDKRIYDDRGKFTDEDHSYVPELAPTASDRAQVPGEESQPVKDELNKVHEQATYWFFKYLYVNLSHFDKWTLKVLRFRKPERVRPRDLDKWYKEYRARLASIGGIDKDTPYTLTIINTLVNLGLINYDSEGVSITALGDLFLEFDERESTRLTEVLTTGLLTNICDTEK